MNMRCSIVCAGLQDFEDPGQVTGIFRYGRRGYEVLRSLLPKERMDKCLKFKAGRSVCKDHSLKYEKMTKFLLIAEAAPA